MLHLELAPILTSIFSQSISTGEIPEDWAAAWITPVFKKGPRSDPANYRPVSLTCISCKLLEHILCTHIRSHLDRHNILTPCNHGFRSRHSCETQLLLTTHDIINRRETSKQVDVAILDLSKAFDTVPHKRLLNKLTLYGINGNIHRWISSFLTHRRQQVVIDGAQSSEESVLSGVPQGTVLGPLLFLLHLNDLPSVLDPGTVCRLFADDCLLYRNIRSIADQLQLQQDLLNLEKWAANWGMKFNAKKCYIMTVHRSKAPPLTHFYQLCDSFLASANEEKYLGVIISDDMSWAPHIESVTTAASQKLGFLARNLKGCPSELKKTAYQAIVRSSLEYASPIWDPHQANHKAALEGVQRRAARWICNKYSRRESVTQMLQALNLEPLEERRRQARLTLLYKILNGAVAVPPDELGIHQNPRATRGLSTKMKLLVPSCTTTAKSTHFVSRTIPQWNKLPDTTTAADTVPRFKSQLSGSSCP